MAYIDLSLKNYVNKVATKPMPGGGSIAALSCALAVALLMKATLIGRKKITKDMIRLKERFLEIVDKDILMFKAGPKEAASILVELCRIINRTLKLAEPICKDAKPVLKGDIEMAQGLLITSFDSAQNNIKSNLRAIKDKKFVTKTINDTKSLLKDISIWRRKY